MSKRDLSKSISLKSMDQLFGLDEKTSVTEPGQETAQVSGTQIAELQIEDLIEFEGHPFKVLDDEKMNETVESIKEYGVLVPIIVRPSDYAEENGKYEILSGHRRCHASKLAGKETIPAMIKNCSDDEATIIMVDANIQREDISIWEKAKAYRMKYDALKHQGSTGGSTLEAMSDTSGDNVKSIQRFIRLSYLSDDLLEMVDQKKMGMAQGIDLSYLSDELQESVYNFLPLLQKPLSQEQATLLKEAFKKEELNSVRMSEILAEKKKPEPRKVSFNAKRLDNYFAPNMTNTEIEDLIIQLLDEWKERGGDA
ncbi:MAG: ParB/RepB/Spo0J family partition protein [Lachnospiraceae bacterium]|nr:ParB/RepB/Spo0J family partition protein [Lachnospiraceae bacterium]